MSRPYHELWLDTQYTRGNRRPKRKRSKSRLLKKWINKAERLERRKRRREKDRHDWMPFQLWVERGIRLAFVCVRDLVAAIADAAKEIR